MNQFLLVNESSRFRFFLIIGLCLCVGLMGTFTQKTAENNQPKMNPETHSVVVLELFTSQGCSSCPPADALLAKYATDTHKQVIPLSFHVDYWNRLGWTDPFSQHIYSERQDWYGNRIPGSSLYTPQLIIDGKYQLVGSNRTAIETLVQKELAQTKQGSIRLTRVLPEKDRIRFQYEAVNPAEILNVALIEKKVATSIRSGENAGLNLLNCNIVRSFQSQIAATEGEGRIRLPPDYTAGKFALVLYTQGKTKTAISSAVYRDLLSIENQ